MLTKKGFTMVEVIVVVVLMMILASGSVLGISEWQRWSAFRKQNDTAQTLYLNLQNQLTRRIENGREQELLDALTDENQEFLHVLTDVANVSGANAELPQLTGKNGSSCTLEKIFSLEGQKLQDPKQYTEEICYVIGTAADYEKYVQYQKGAITASDLDNGTTGMTGKELVWFYELLSAGLYDPSVLDAAVCVEFTPYDGQVYSVFYSEKAERFSYGNSGTDITNRTSDRRKETMTGYFGVDTLSVAKGAAARPELSEVQLAGADTLGLEFQVTEAPEARSALTYEVTLYDGETEEPLLRIWLPGEKLKTEDQTFAPVWCEVSRYENGGWSPLQSSAVNETERGKYPFYAKLTGENGVQLVLDAADLTATDDAWYRVLQYDDTAAKAQMDASNSLYRFRLSAEQIYCTVQGSGASYKNTQIRQSNRTWCSFASVRSEQRGEASVRVCTIENFRELYNLRYEEERNQEAVTEYQLSNGLDWQAFTANGNLFSGCLVVTEEQAAFPSIRRLQASSTLTSATGQSIVLSGLRLSEETNRSANLYVSDGAAELAGATGLFAQNAGTIRQVTFQKTQVLGSGMTGAACGQNTGTLDQITVEEAEITVAGTAETPAVAGGLVGKNSGIVTRCETSGVLTVDRGNVGGSAVAGGLIGIWENGAAELVDCSSCMRVELRSAGAAAGLIGRLQNQIGMFLLRNDANYGTIQVAGADGADSAAAGILAMVSGCGEMVLRLEQCRNEGEINGQAVRSAGIIALAQSGDDQTARTELSHCLNYGNGEQDTFCGIASVLREQDTVDECEDFSDPKDTEDSTEESTGEATEEVTAPATENSAEDATEDLE